MDNSKIKVSCVSYLNSMPFLYGLKNSPVNDKIIMQLDHPSDCANKLIRNEADLGLIPIAALSRLESYEIISDFCIGSKGPVESVVLISNVPLQSIETVILDYQSITSIKLVQILCDKYWNIQPQYTQSYPSFEESVEGATAAVIIGDRALKIRNNYKYVYDLAQSWNLFTGLPFVFACWVSNKKLTSDFKDQFNKALKFGIDNIHEVIKTAEDSGNYSFNVQSYLTDRLSFHLTSDLREGMNLFLKYAGEHNKEFIDR